MKIDVLLLAAFQGSGEPADGEHGGGRRLRAQPGQQLQRRRAPPSARQQQRVGALLAAGLVRARSPLLPRRAPLLHPNVSLVFSSGAVRAR